MQHTIVFGWLGGWVDVQSPETILFLRYFHPDDGDDLRKL